MSLVVLRPVGHNRQVVTGSMQRAEPRRRWWRIVRNAIVLLAVAAAGGWSAGFQRSYGTWPGLDVKDRINWCARVYRTTVTDLTWVEVDRDSKSPLQVLFSYPPYFPRRAVLGVRPEPGGCPAALYIRTGFDRYTKYRASAP
jgi:hypothetical protein